MSEPGRPTARISIFAAALLFVLAAAFTSFSPESAYAHKDHNKPKPKVEAVKVEEAKAAPVPTHESAEKLDWSSVQDSIAEQGSSTEPEHDLRQESPQESPHDSPHDHAVDHGDHAESSTSPLEWLGRFHPPLTHFPIALIVAAALAEFLFMRRPSALFEHATRYCVWLGTGGALLAALLGWFYAGFHLVDEEWVMTTHRWFGTGTALWSALIFVLCERAYAGRAPRQPFRLALFAGAGLVSVTGFFGGALLYGLDHFTS